MQKNLESSWNSMWNAEFHMESIWNPYGITFFLTEFHKELISSWNSKPEFLLEYKTQKIPDGTPNGIFKEEKYFIRNSIRNQFLMEFQIGIPFGI